MNIFMMYARIWYILRYVLCEVYKEKYTRFRKGWEIALHLYCYQLYIKEKARLQLPDICIPSMISTLHQH